MYHITASKSEMKVISCCYKIFLYIMKTEIDYKFVALNLAVAAPSSFLMSIFIIITFSGLSISAPIILTRFLGAEVINDVPDLPGLSH